MDELVNEVLCGGRMGGSTQSTADGQARRYGRGGLHAGLCVGKQIGSAQTKKAASSLLPVSHAALPQITVATCTPVSFVRRSTEL
jgi:hypothetical protein